VGVPSNLERFVHQRVTLPDLQRDLQGMAFGSEAILEGVARAPQDWGVTACPHTVCGLLALETLRAAGDHGGWIVAATAHPAKFPEIVEPRIGAEVPIPQHLAHWLARPASADRVPADVAEVALRI
jgi:threonine synthase